MNQVHFVLVLQSQIAKNRPAVVVLSQELETAYL